MENNRVASAWNKEVIIQLRCCRDCFCLGTELNFFFKYTQFGYQKVKVIAFTHLT